MYYGGFAPILHLIEVKSTELDSSQGREEFNEESFGNKELMG